MDFIRRHKLIAATIAIQLIVLPIILIAVKQQQDTQTKAQQSTTLFFAPATSTSTPLEKNPGENFSMDLMVNPGNNMISLARIEVNYDPTKVKLQSSNPVTVNIQAFPVTVEGPLISETGTTGKVQIVVSVGADQTRVIQTETKVLTLNFTAVAPINQTQISFGPTNMLLSIAPTDTSTENVLSSTIPAFIKVNALPTATPTIPPSDTQAPVISNVSATNITQTGAKINWTLNEYASGQVEYGTTTSYGSLSALQTCCTYNYHIQSLSGLTAGTTYHYRVKSTDQAGNQAVSGDFTFTTAIPTPTPTAPPGPTSCTSPSFCSLENETCTFSGTRVIAFVGASGIFTTKTLTSPVACTTATFDVPPQPTANNACYVCEPTPTPTSIPVATVTPTPTPIPTATTLNFSGLKLHGLGKGGDNPNPTSDGTLNPLRPTRTLTVQVYNTSEILVNTVSGNITYSGSSTGVFNGSVVLPSTLASGDYIIKIRTPYYLTKKLPGFMSLVKGQANNAPSASLIAGDVNGDNRLSVEDYDLIIDCYSDLQAPRNCNTTKKLNADISDDGLVNQDDYNLFLRELSVQQGD